MVQDAISILRNVESREEETCHAHFDENAIPKPSEDSKNRIFVTLEIHRENCHWLPHVLDWLCNVLPGRHQHMNLLKTGQRGFCAKPGPKFAQAPLQLTEEQLCPRSRGCARPLGPNCSPHSSPFTWRMFPACWKRQTRASTGTSHQQHHHTSALLLRMSPARLGPSLHAGRASV